MAESLKAKFYRWTFNFFPAYRRTGGRIIYISQDLQEVRVKLPLNWKTRNYVGTIFGGSLYGAVDPIYMIMLIKLLGPDYIVWDKAATIRFKKPGRSTLFATFKIDNNELDAIRNALAKQNPLNRNYIVDLVDKQGIVHATCEKVIYFRKKGRE